MTTEVSRTPRLGSGVHPVAGESAHHPRHELGYFDVVYEEAGEYISNKGLPITPHHDAPTREYMPGVQIFRCVENSVGGDSFWVDGFDIAETLRRERPDAFRLLASVPWEHANRNSDTEYHTNMPIIILDPAVSQQYDVEARWSTWSCRTPTGIRSP